MPEKITSLQNSRIKNVVLLQDKSAERRKQNTIVVEGWREIQRASQAGFEAQTLFYCPELISKHSEIQLDTLNFAENNIFEINQAVFEKIAYREGSDGLVGLFQPKHLTINQLQLRPHPLILVLEAVEKPGNLGAMLRTSDAAYLDAIIVCEPLTDLYNPNVIRASLGCVFHQQVVACSSQEAHQYLKSLKIKTYAAALTETAQAYHHQNYQEATAFVMGTEADGLSDFWLKNSDNQVIIPMNGKADSLNVSVSAAILVFEAMRQRDFR